MGLFDLFKSTNEINLDATKTTTQSGGSGMITDGGGGSSVNITEDTALTIAALNQGISIIAETVASMPIYLHKDIDGFQTTLTDDPRSLALSGITCNVLTSYNLKRSLIKDLILYGNAYAQITQTGGGYDFTYYPPNIVTAHYDTTGYFFNVQTYTTAVLGETVPQQIVANEDMLVLTKNPKYNSILGQGLLTQAKNTLSMAIEEENYMINLFQNGLSAKSILASKSPFKKEIKEQLKKDIRDLYSGSKNSGKTLVLEGDISVLPLALTPTDIKLLESQKFTVAEIARFLNIPKYMLNIDRGQGTYSNITMERMQLLTNTLTPYCIALEQALNQKLLSTQEQAEGCYFKCNTKEMLKMSPQDNATYMLSLYQNNVVTLEEVRASLNLGGDDATINELKQYQQLKMQQTVNQVANTTPNDSNEIAEKNQLDKTLNLSSKDSDTSLESDTNSNTDNNTNSNLEDNN